MARIVARIGSKAAMSWIFKSQIVLTHIRATRMYVYGGFRELDGSAMSLQLRNYPRNLRLAPLPTSSISSLFSLTSLSLSLSFFFFFSFFFFSLSPRAPPLSFMYSNSISLYQGLGLGLRGAKNRRERE